MKISEEISHKFANMAIVCAFLVAVIHCRPFFAAGTVAWWVKQMLEMGICTMAVPFFFLASGFFLAGHVAEPQWWGKEVRKRVLTLLIPYFLLTTIVFAYVLAKSICGGASYGYELLRDPQLLLNLYGIGLTGCPGVTPLWYVRGLFVLVLVSPILLKIAEAGKVGLACLFALYGLICPGPGGSGYVHELTRNGVLPMAGFFYFTLGMAIRLSEGDKLAEVVSAGYKHGLCFATGILLVVLQATLRYFECPFYLYAGWLAIPFLLWGGLWPCSEQCLAQMVDRKRVSRFSSPQVLLPSLYRQIVRWREYAAGLYAFCTVCLWHGSWGVVVVAASASEVCANSFGYHLDGRTCGLLRLPKHTLVW